MSPSPFFHILVFFALVAACSAPQTPKDNPLIERHKPTLDSIVTPLLETGYATDVVIAVIDGDEVVFFSYGPNQADEHTLFEIGSVSKTFTGTLLASLTESKHLTPSTTLGALLSGTTLSEDTAKITLLELTTHTSGLPRLPDNIDLIADPDDPYAAYDEAALLAYLESASPNAAKTWGYSNLGAGLLGHLLGQVHGAGYEAALEERIFVPLEMHETAIALSPELEARFIQGHDIRGRPTAPWAFDTLAGAGAIRSTAHDMTRYLRAQLSPSDTPLGQSIRRTQKPERATMIPEYDMGYGWFMRKDGQVGWHNGGTGGFYTFAGFNKERGVGIIWLSNATLWRVPILDKTLVGWLEGKEPKPLELKKPVDLPQDVLASYEGTYSYMIVMRFEIRLEGDDLLFGKAGEPGTALLAESEGRFFLPEVPNLVFAFETAEDGTLELILYEDGEEEMRARRK